MEVVHILTANSADYSVLDQFADRHLVPTVVLSLGGVSVGCGAGLLSYPGKSATNSRNNTAGLYIDHSGC